MFDQEGGDNLFDGEFVVVWQAVNLFPILQQFLDGNYADHFTYTAAGAVSSMQLGNNRWELTQFNSRLQPTQIALGSTKFATGSTTQGATDILKLNYDYGSTQNNGNVQSQTITVPTVGSNPGFTAIQTYTY